LQSYDGVRITRLTSKMKRYSFDLLRKVYVNINTIIFLSLWFSQQLVVCDLLFDKLKSFHSSCLQLWYQFSGMWEQLILSFPKILEINSYQLNIKSRESFVFVYFMAICYHLLLFIILSSPSTPSMIWSYDINWANTNIY
jgi:hypothetical protein